MTGDLDDLDDRLREIEREPLEARSTAFTAVYEGLQRALEAGDPPRSNA